jgi:hypothetical protein
MQDDYTSGYYSQIDQTTQTLMIGSCDKDYPGPGTSGQILQSHNYRYNILQRGFAAFSRGNSFAVRTGWRMSQHGTDRLGHSWIENMFKRAARRMQAIIIEFKHLGK